VTGIGNQKTSSERIRSVLPAGIIAALIFCIAFMSYCPALAEESSKDQSAEKSSGSTNDVDIYSDSYGGSKKFFSDYGNYFLARTKQISEMDRTMWGVSTWRVPRGVLGLNVDYTFFRFDSRYNSKGKADDLVPSMRVPNPFEVNGRYSDLKLNAKGHGNEVSTKVSYGFTDSLCFFLEVPFRWEEIWLHPKFYSKTPGGYQITSQDDLWGILELLGRPKPETYYKTTTYDLGDIQSGVAWNYFRNEYVSLSTIGRMIFPTGRLADPNEALMYGLGPQIDEGKGAFAPGISHAVDVRMPGKARLLGFAVEVDYAYYFQSARMYPKFLKPNSDFVRLLSRDGYYTADFQDMSGLNGEYHVVFGSSLDSRASIFFDMRYVLFTMGYGFSWADQPLINSDSAAFMHYIGKEGLDSFGASQCQSVLFRIYAPIYRLGIPIRFALSTEIPLAGKNSRIYKDEYSGSLELMIPF